MWHSDILKKLDTLFTCTLRSNSESSKEFRCSACSKKPEEKNLSSPSWSLLHPAVCEKAQAKLFTWTFAMMKFPIFAILACIGHLHIIVSKNYLLEAKPRISSFHPNWRSYRDFTETSHFPRLSIYTQPQPFLNGQLSTHCHRRQWVFRVKQINWKEEAGREEEKSRIVAELMCFCLLWIVSSSPL